ncbi:MAG: (Fe-S)-binding protein [Deltaproteobacteria bacterium]|jgi:glycolate oxidase iron-sulfur subunit|nr:(Fe-S)-binding protein [Deltaproteobacteria bacterium]
MSEKHAPAGLAELAGMLMSLDDLLVSCMRCGFCQSVCPVYGATFREADVARGKIALLEDLARELTEDADNVSDRLDRCLLCGSCESNCPSGVAVMDIFLRARCIVAGWKGLSAAKRLILRNVLTRPVLFNLLVRFSSLGQKLVMRRASPRQGTGKAPMLERFLGDRHVPALPKTTFASARGRIDLAGRGPKVALFPGCVPDKLFGSLAEATLRILKKHDCGVFCPSDELACCGIPSLASGDMSSFKELVGLNLKALSGHEFDYLVTPCATCASNIKENWRRFKGRFDRGERAAVEEIGPRTMDMTSFLVRVLKVDFKAVSGPGKVVTYHDPCHLKKSLGVSAEPRTILKSLPGFNYKEMPEADRCCGNGGSFNLSHYDLSKDIGSRKRANIMSVKPDVVATGCPACMLQLNDMLSRNGDPVEVRHVVELYAETL